MHVTFDARYFRATPSGLGEYTRALVERLPALEPTARFSLWVSPSAPHRPVSPHPNVDERVVAAGPNGLRTLAAPALLGPLGDTDLFHAPFNLLGRGVRCRTVVTVTDVMWLTDAGLIEAWSWMRPLRALYYRAGTMHALRHASRVITISHASADAIERLVPGSSRRVVPIHLAAHERFKPPADEAAARARATLLVGTDRPYLLVVGRNSEYKWHEGAVRAMAALRDRDAVLALVQRVEHGGNLADIARSLGVSDRVRWLGGLPADDVLTLMQCATALVHPSTVEGFGLPVLEAMACGTPVVAGEAGSLLEITDGAALHAPRDVGKLAGAIDELLADASMRADLRARGLVRARAFSWDRVANETLDVYRDAIR
jgi:glycosyltransferase involved in cell wall biosynthesis